MTGLRPLMLCLLAILNTAFWAGILHLVGLFITIPLSPAARIGILAVIFVLSLIILASIGSGGPNGGPPDSAANGP